MKFEFYTDLFLLLFILVFCIGVVSALQVYQEKLPLTNVSNSSVNNSQYLQGYTPTTLKDWMQSFFDTIYCKLTGCDMTGDIDMGGNNIDEVLRVTYNTTGCEEDSIGGTTCWNPDDYTLNVVTGIDNTVIQVGQEVVGIGINKEGTFLPDGTIVSAVSAQGDRLTFIRADGSNISKSAMIGVLTHDCDANAQCMVTVFGTVRNVDTSMFTSGDKLYIDSNSPGNFTNITPTLPNNPTWVATVNVVHPQVGTIFVNPQIDPEDGFLINDIYATNGIQINNSNIYLRYNDSTKDIDLKDGTKTLLNITMEYDNETLKNITTKYDIKDDFTDMIYDENGTLINIISYKNNILIENKTINYNNGLIESIV